MYKFFFVIIFVCSACHDHTKKQPNQVIHTGNPSSTYQTGWKCPYCGMYLDEFNTDIMDHKQKKCLLEHHSSSSSFEEELDEAYQRGYEDGKRENMSEN